METLYEDTFTGGAGALSAHLADSGHSYAAGPSGDCNGAGAMGRWSGWDTVPNRTGEASDLKLTGTGQLTTDHASQTGGLFNTYLATALVNDVVFPEGGFRIDVTVDFSKTWTQAVVLFWIQSDQSRAQVGRLTIGVEYADFAITGYLGGTTYLEADVLEGGVHTVSLVWLENGSAQLLLDDEEIDSAAPGTILRPSGTGDKFAIEFRYGQPGNHSAPASSGFEGIKLSSAGPAPEPPEFWFGPIGCHTE